MGRWDMLKHKPADWQQHHLRPTQRTSELARPTQRTSELAEFDAKCKEAMLETVFVVILMLGIVVYKWLTP